MLAKGVAVDLETLPVGASATTMVGPLGVHLTRTGVSSFELIVLRSFAVALWRDLSAMAAEY
jgi:sarcosine oxidase subunit gamma